MHQDYYLIEVKPSTTTTKKWTAFFGHKDSKRIKKVSFGAKGMDDYTLTHDKAQRERYRTRHKKDLETGDPLRAGFLSYYLLWNKKTLNASIQDYKERFHL